MQLSFVKLKYILILLVATNLTVGRHQLAGHPLGVNPYNTPWSVDKMVLPDNWRCSPMNNAIMPMVETCGKTMKNLSKLDKVAGFSWMLEFQDPKMELLYHIFSHIFWGYSLKHRPYIPCMAAAPVPVSLSSISCTNGEDRSEGSWWPLMSVVTFTTGHSTNQKEESCNMMYIYIYMYICICICICVCIWIYIYIYMWYG